MNETQQPPLPELHEGLLDPDLLAVYFADLIAHAEIIGVMAKSGAEDFANLGDLDVERGRELLSLGAVRGLQIRYRFDGLEWWDTLVRTPERVRLVRIEQRFR